MASPNACIRIEKKINGSFECEAHTKTLHELTYSARHTYAFAVSQFIDICVHRSSRASDALPSGRKTNSVHIKTQQTHTRINVTKPRCTWSRRGSGKESEHILRHCAIGRLCVFSIENHVIYSHLQMRTHSQALRAANRNYKSTEIIELREERKKNAVEQRYDCCRCRCATCVCAVRHSLALHFNHSFV